MSRSRRIVVDNTDSWLFREFFSTDPNAGTDGTVNHGNADYILFSELGNGDVQFSATPAVYGDLTDSFKTFVVWSKGIISFGQPTDEQLAFMAGADANTDFGNFPGAFISAGFQDPGGPDIYVGLLNPDKVGLQNAYTRVEFGDTTVLIYADHVSISKAGVDSDKAIVDLGTGVQLTYADAENGSYRLTRFLTVDGNDGDNVLTGTAAAQSIHGHDGNDTITAGSGASDLYGEAGNDILTGGVGIDHLFGGDGSDTITAGSGDVVDAGSGNDTIFASRLAEIAGGSDTDTLVLDFSAESGAVTLALGDGPSGSLDSIGTRYTSIERIDITGSAFNDVLTGNSGGNTINGGVGADIIDGGAGSDTLDAGIGGVSPEGPVTSFGIDASSAVSIDNSFSNVVGSSPLARIDINHSIFDTVDAFYSFNVTSPGDLTLDSHASLFDSSGNSVTISSSAAGQDTYLNLSAGSYTIEIFIQGEIPDFGSGVRYQTDSFAVSLSTAVVPNRHNVLTGGTGNDTFLVHRSDDNVVEKTGEGTDTVIADLSWTLGDNLEKLTLKAGAGGINGTGNGLANTIIGNEGNNTLNGGNGDDRLVGGAGNDLLHGDPGADRMEGGTGNDSYWVGNKADLVVELTGEGTDKVFANLSYALTANVENLVLVGTANLNGTGNALPNVIAGNSGANVLDGGAGIDTMLGGAGDDTYKVDNSSDKVFETKAVGSTVNAGGLDKVISSASYTLDAPGRQFVENLLLVGLNPINGAGNALANRIEGNAADNILTGNGGKDTLLGADGNDRLSGGAGSDTLGGGKGNDQLNPGSGQDLMTGGLGADRFVFTKEAVLDATTTSTADRIADFNHAEGDKIDLSLIDSNPLVGGDQAFTFIGTAAFSGNGSELQVSHTNTATYLVGDYNGDGIGDFYIRLAPGLTLAAGDFML